MRTFPQFDLPIKRYDTRSHLEIMNMLSSNDNANDNNGTMMDTNFTAPDNYDYGNQAKAMFGGYGSAVNGGGRDSPFRSRPRGIRWVIKGVTGYELFEYQFSFLRKVDLNCKNDEDN